PALRAPAPPITGTKRTREMSLAGGAGPTRTPGGGAVTAGSADGAANTPRGAERVERRRRDGVAGAGADAGGSAGGQGGGPRANAARGGGGGAQLALTLPWATVPPRTAGSRRLGLPTALLRRYR